MKNHYPRLFFSLLLSIFFFSVNAQVKDNIWSITNNNNLKKDNITFYKENPKHSTLISIDIDKLNQKLVNVPQRHLSNKNQGVVLQFPNQLGKPESYLVQEASVMEVELQVQFPEIRSFVGKGIDNPSAILRFSISPQKGFSGMVLSDGKTVFIEPYTADLKTYISFINSNEDGPRQEFICETEYQPSSYNLTDEEYTALRNADDGTLRTYRLALACTGEYAQFHGGTTAGALAAMNVTMNRVNGVFERDLGLTMVIVANNQNIIFLNAASDPYTNNNGGAMLGQNQTTLDNPANIGSANYDIGHVFSTGGGGIAQLQSPCRAGFKARGVTGSFIPQGDAFDIDFVAHEMGHQYGGNHTQNNNCQRSPIRSIEPGSGSTIMGYAGICAPNVQNNSDDYFNGENIKEMWNNISFGFSSSCFAATATNNVAPNADAGANFSIPRSTAFVLKGTATDADTPAGLTYCWEQTDTTPAAMPPQSTNTGGPTFRSLDPSTSPDRYMPPLNIVMAGSLATTWEVVPSVGRTMNFSLTVRDNEANGGATDSDGMVVNVQDVTPFTVNTPPSWGANTNQQVSWVVGQTDVAPINCQTVNILFTTNNGGSFTTLASGVPNTGTANITVPGVGNTNNAKVLVEAADNIFYAVSNAFSISNSQDFSISSTTGDVTVCNQDTATIEFDYVTSNGFSETTTFSVSGVPGGVGSSINPTTLNSDGTVTLNLTGLGSLASNTYPLTLTGSSASITRQASVDLIITDGVCPSEGSLQYQTRTTGVIFNTINNLNPGAKITPYSDFTGISTTVEAGMNYDLTVRANSDGNFQIITRVWVDWNQNCSFDDLGEEYDLGTSAGIADEPTDGSPLTVMVPNDAAEGATIMRVSTKYTDPNANQFPTSCESGFDGEVEDYTLNVINNLSVDDNELDNLSIYPNPNNGSFNIGFNPKSGEDIRVQVYDIRGRAIYTKTFNAVSRFDEIVRLNNAQSGVYLLNIFDGSQKVTKKIIVD
ncbi:reprolysin-like metallopeptidase [uncultured Winogradskyella sp.]|uniref:reprolysin-like metallopeptidase n=1 Tax=uncultured Winogradskyella sp. TaxID=395353 RepID=UPI00260FB859|nr:zinc-dependent metalloprotease family protein [uncultured Winogradskyella sp.]